MKIFILKIMYKIFTTIENFIDYAYIELCKSRGLKLGPGVQFIKAPSFGSEPYLVSIGAHSKITAGCIFITHDGATYVIRNMEKFKDARSFGRIAIGENCFVGNNCIFLPGSKMGNNCILGAGSVLTTTMPDNTVYAGVPARFICTTEAYGDKMIKNNTIYPRDLELHRPSLDKYIKENLPFNYKPVKN